MSLRTSLSLLFILIVVSFALISSATPRTAGRVFETPGKVSQPSPRLRLWTNKRTARLLLRRVRTLTLPSRASPMQRS